jgi:hypothetical protein
MPTRLMADEPKVIEKREADARRDPGEKISYWAEKLGVTAEELLSALEEVAPIATD